MQFAGKGRNVQARDFYSYVLNFSALASGATTTQSFTVDTDSDFFMMKIAQVSDIAAAAYTRSAIPIPLVTMQITDGGSSRQLFSDAVPLDAVAGRGENPFILPSPRKFAASSSVTVQLTNYDAATTYNIRLALIGEKRYRR